MKPFLTVIALFALLTAFAQPLPGDDLMESQIQRLTMKPDHDLLGLQPEKPNEIRHNGLTYSGILVEMVKTDKPLELINPAAPSEYGSSEDNVVRDPETGRDGLKLLSIQF